jgi:DNA polymerase-3 subunit epsilon|tara:strand:+ start:2778 stop:3449 length:672 start_codon:yes stop_codon:yes gene_type:complete
MNEIILDTETTGLSYRDSHKIVEIACIETMDLIPTGKTFHKIINPERTVPNEAYKIHGFSTDFLKSKETFNQIADSFLKFIENKNLIIHNAAFDLGFLNFELRLSKREEIKKNKIIDTLELARGKFLGSSNSLDALCKRFNIDLSKRTKHNALLDCQLLREVYINLIDAKEPRLLFQNDKEESINNTIKAINFKYSKKVIKASDEDLKKHKDFLKKELKKNYY